MRRTFALAIALWAASLGAPAPRADEKPTTLRGVVYRGDKEHPAADAEVVLLAEKKENSARTKTDAKGVYAFERVAGGKYTVSIRTFHQTQEAVPCQLLVAKTKDKDSAVLAMREGGNFVEQVFIKNFAVKSGRENVRDFDIACRGIFEK